MKLLVYKQDEKGFTPIPTGCDAFNRNDLAATIESTHIEVGGKQYHVNEVSAVSDHKFWSGWAITCIVVFVVLWIANHKTSSILLLAGVAIIASLLFNLFVGWLDKKAVQEFNTSLFKMAGLPGTSPTYIESFVVVKPFHQVEKEGDILKLSEFGYYQHESEASIGCDLGFLLRHPSNYQPYKWIHNGSNPMLLSSIPLNESGRPFNITIKQQGHE